MSVAMCSLLSIGDQVTMLSHKPPNKWKPLGEYEVVAIRKNDIDLRKASSHYRESVPIFDLRAGRLRLIRGGQPVSFGGNPDFRKLIDERMRAIIQVNASPAGQNFNDERDTEEVEVKQMKRADVQNHLAVGKSINDLIDMYQPLYPEMSIRRLRTQIIRLSKVKEQNTNSGNHDEAASVAEKSMHVAHKVDSEMNGEAGKSTGRPKPHTKKRAQAETIIPLQYLLPKGNFTGLLNSFIIELMRSNGYVPAESASSSSVDLCILTLPFTTRGCFELGRAWKRFQKVVVIGSNDFLPEDQKALIEELAGTADIAYVEDAADFVCELKKQARR